jgi:hypothetical protein
LLPAHQAARLTTRPRATPRRRSRQLRQGGWVRQQRTPPGGVVVWLRRQARLRSSDQGDGWKVQVLRRDLTKHLGCPPQMTRSAAPHSFRAFSRASDTRRTPKTEWERGRAFLRLEWGTSPVRCEANNEMLDGRALFWLLTISRDFRQCYPFRLLPDSAHGSPPRARGETAEWRESSRAYDGPTSRPCER